MEKMSISDVAKLAGVSTTTVSRVINNVKTVKEVNRQRVMDAVRALKYKPNVSAQRLAGSKVNTIGLIMPRFEDMFHSFYAMEILKGTSSMVERHNFDLLLRATELLNIDLNSYERTLNITQTAGVLFADVDSNWALVEMLKKEDVPFVVMNNFIEDPNISCVGIENREGTKNLIRYLLGLGHTQIAIIAGDLKNQSARARFYGFSETLEENNIKPDERCIMTGNWTKESARQATLELIKLDKRPTAIFASSDEMAYEVIITLRENNIKVPGDISVAGFDDSPFSTISEVPITTVHQPIYEMARESCEILVNILKEPKQPPIKKLLNTNLVERASCKKIV